MNSPYYVKMCSLCGTRQASHCAVGGRITLDLCCECWIEAGHPPTDWHPKCMAAYERRIERQARVDRLWSDLTDAVNTRAKTK